jgi:hypothetical protein
MSTYSAHRRVTGSGHPLNGGLEGYCRGNIPCIPWATGYSINLWIWLVPSSGKRLGNHTTHTREWPHHSSLKRRTTNIKRTNPGNNPCHHFSTLWLARADEISRPVCPSRLSRWPGAETRSPGQPCPGLPVVDKYRPLWPSGSSNLRRLAWRDIAVGTNTRLIVCTWVWNPSHDHLA